MIHADEIQNGSAQIRFSMTLVERAQMPFDSSMATAEQANSARLGELALSGPQALAGCGSALGKVGLLLLAVIKLWLLEP